MQSHARRAVALAAALPLLSGCFSYVPAEPASVPAGEEVRVFLTRDAVLELQDAIPTSGSALRGRITGREDDLLTLRVPVTAPRAGLQAPDIGQDVRIATGQILELQRREFSPARTGLLVAGAAGAASMIILLIMDDAGATPQPGPGDGPEVIRIPLLSLPTR